ncbi:MAG: Exodeoxyribonuclease [Candidatus Saccharibacteria bacterium]|nr:Exodeoxyribonuclease [Candidatus Saccharibacteria bacterium]
MAASFFFYDLETSGFSPHADRIMQFAGQRTDTKLQPIGEPVNLSIKLPPDVLPSPDAILITGITPQSTLADGLTEVEFLRYFYDEIATPDTCFVGYNTVRFDDEFMRCLNYRNFYDPYEWQWQDGRGRWDLLDVVRMTRALRPDGINWPMTEDGKPTNRLELLTKENGLAHEHAHDALSDVYATISIAQLIRDKQPKLFDWLYQTRTKKAVQDVVEGGQPFVYTSGKYPAEYEKTTAVWTICQHPGRQGALVYDLRHDPTPYLAMDIDQIVDAWRWKKDREDQPLPIKSLQYNRCPAIAPLGVLDAPSQQRLKLSLDTIQKHVTILKQARGFSERLCKALEVLDDERSRNYVTDQPADARLYDGFCPEGDKAIQRAIRAAQPAELNVDQFSFKDKRFRELLPLYKARNFSSAMTEEEQLEWEAYRSKKLFGGGQNSQLAKYFARLQELAARPELTADQQYLLEELQLYGQSVMPSDVAE